MLRRADAVGRVLGKFKIRSLANAVVVARTVLEDVDMDVVGVRFVGAWAEHGREPADNPLCAPTRSELRQIS